MKNIILLLTIFTYSLNTLSQNKVNWLSFEKGIELHKKNPKPILIQIYADWCGYCKKMDNETYSNKVIINYINQNFYAIKLNGEEKKDITYEGHTFKNIKYDNSYFHELAAYLLDDRLIYPTTIFMDENEQILNKIPGYLSKENFEKILSFFSKDDYKTKNWEEYKKNFKSNL